MSKFIKKLRQISESAAPPMGFRTSSISPSRLMLLIASLTQDNANKATELTRGEVDAILIQSQDLGGEIKGFRQMADSLGDVPLGMWFESMTEVKATELQEMGIDFLVFTASKAPAALLQEEIGKVMKIDFTYDDSLIQTIDQLPVDAIIIDLKEERGNLTVSHIMSCQRLVDLTNKPLIVAIQQKLTDQELRALWEAGANGVAVEVKEETQQILTELRNAIKALPPATRKPKEGRVVLTHSEQEAGSEAAEEV